MRMTLHLAAAEDFPAYAQLDPAAADADVAQTYPRFDEEHVVRELAGWLPTPRTNPEIRERVASYEGAPEDP